MAKVILEKTDVIPALADIFRRYGFDGASIALISEHTKLGKGSLYNFFPGGKDEMAKAVLTDIDNWFEEHIFLPLEQNDVDAIAKMFDAVDKYFQNGRRICLIGAMALIETRDRFSEDVKQYFNRWINVLTENLVQQGHNRTYALQRATTTIASIQGAIVISQALDDEKYFNDILSSLREMNISN